MIKIKTRQQFSVTIEEPEIRRILADHIWQKIVADVGVQHDQIPDVEAIARKINFDEFTLEPRAHVSIESDYE